MAQETLDRRLSAIERRTGKLEAKFGEIETGFAETLYHIHRTVIELAISNRRLTAVVGTAPVTPEEVDAVLEEQS